MHLSEGDADRAQDALQATFLTALQDAGRWELEVRAWDKRSGSARVEVPARAAVEIPLR